MPDSEAKRKWMSENTTVITLKLNNRTDNDILDFLSGKNKQGEIKKCIRKEIERQ